MKTHTYKVKVQNTHVNISLNLPNNVSKPKITVKKTRSPKATLPKYKINKKAIKMKHSEKYLKYAKNNPGGHSQNQNMIPNISNSNRNNNNNRFGMGYYKNYGKSIYGMLENSRNR